MTALAYYVEHDQYAAGWLRNLIKAGMIMPGFVDTRSIEDVRPSDLAGFTQVHLYAGIGVWSYALRCAGWSDRRGVWTISCPCQPFSTAGKGGGFDDERHLWPATQWLIGQCRPVEILGEQVASKDAEPWIDLVHADLEALGYAFGCVPFPSAGIGAPHIRDRNYWAGRVADSDHEQRPQFSDSERQGQQPRFTNGGLTSRLGDSNSIGRQGVIHLPGAQQAIQPQSGHESIFRGLADNDKYGCGALAIAGIHDAQYHTQSCSSASGLANAADIGQLGRWASRPSHGGGSPRFESERLCNAGGVANNNGGGWVRGQDGQFLVDGPQAGRQQSYGQFEPRSEGVRPNPVNGYWSNADWIGCRDGKWRPVEPGTFPLANGSAGGVGRVRADQGHRAGRLKGYGNALNAEAAIEFIKSYMEC